MKKLFSILTILFLMVNVFAETTSIEKLFNLKFDTKKEIPTEELTAIFYILSHTYENNIHKMRGETGNQVYVSDDGREAVYDAKGNLVTNEYNKGTYNYAKYEEPFKKWDMDILPWLAWGNSNADPTDFNERLYYYLWDLDYGIQSYIFEGRKENLKKVAYKDLSNRDKTTAHFFYSILFNSKYEIKLSSKNYKRLETDGDFYYSYFEQILNSFGYKR